MSGMIDIAENNAMPISLQIADGNENQYPQCEIRDNSGVLLETVDLQHSVSGLYIPAANHYMPNKLYVIAKYNVYSDASHTTKNTDYYQTAEMFIKTPNYDKSKIIL
ncbi:MAG: hypothetical protein ACTSXY_15105 [Promethearchaeota archaeon]